MKLTYLQSFLFFLIITAYCCESEQKEISQSWENPNIILIVADDLGYGDLSLTGQEKFATPNIDDLSRKGMFFRQHYAGSTVCAPSRSSLLTGQHTGHTFIRGNRSSIWTKKQRPPEGQFPLDSAATTLAEILKSKGYVTGIYGKWGLGYPKSTGDPINQGFDEFYGYNCQRIAHNYYPYYLWHNQNKKILSGNSEQKTEEYAPEIIHQKALEFIERQKDTTFFLFYPSIIPHAELLAPEKYMKNFREKLLPETPYHGVDSGNKYKNGGYGSQNRTQPSQQ